MQREPKKVLLAIVVSIVMLSSGFAIFASGNAGNNPFLQPNQSTVSSSQPGIHISHSSPPAHLNSGKVSSSPGANTLNLSNGALLEKSVLQQAKQDGIPMKYVYVPDYSTQSKIVSGHVTPGYLTSPAPMGVGDYGLMNKSGQVVTYNYTTGSFMAAVNLTSLADFYLPDNAPQSVSIQLNAVLNNVALVGNANYSFWTQNVIFMSPRTDTIQFLDNVWNFTSTPLTPGTILYSTAVNNSDGQTTTTFHYGLSKVFTISFPVIVDVYLNSTLVNGNSAMFFNYSIPEDHISGTYDEVVFNSTYGQSAGYSAPSPHYLVSGTQLTPLGIPYDAEIMIGGPGGGSTADVSQINGTLNLKFMNATAHSYQNVKAAYDIGSETGETSTGVDVSYSGSTAYLQSGPSLVYGLWNNTYSQTKYSVQYNTVTNTTLHNRNILFTGNVSKDFAGSLLYHQTGTSGNGSNNNITNLYVAYNSSDLFIGLQEHVSGNSIVLYILNNTNSGFGATNMTSYPRWNLSGEYLSRPANDVFTVKYGSGNVNGTNSLYRITSLTSANSISVTSLAYSVLFNSTGNSTELMIPLSEIGAESIGNFVNISFAALVIGGSGEYVDTGVPYAQGAPYPSVPPATFTINNFVSTVAPTVTSQPFLFVQNASSFVYLSGDPTPFTMSELYMCAWATSTSFVLPTATYSYSALLNYYDPAYGYLSNSGVTEIALGSNPSEEMYTPIIATSNAQIAEQASSGNGTISNPYIINVLVNGSLNPLFGQFNDFLFPVFPGELLYNTTAYTEVENSYMFLYLEGYWLLDTEFVDSYYGISLLPINFLPLELYNASNIAVIGGEFASIYSAFSAFSDASVYIWNSSHIILYGNEIISFGIGALVYNSPGVEANVTIYNNIFGGYNVLRFGSENFSINQELAYDFSFDNGAAQYGLQMYSSGNSIYCNEFITQTPVYSPEYNFYTGTSAAYTDNWNNTTEGNAYWNYNFVTPFNESGMISSGYDYRPNSFVSGYNLTFKTGLKYNSIISVSVEGLILAGVNNVTYYDLFSLNEPVSFYAMYGDPVSGYSNVTITGPNNVVNLSSTTLYNTLVISENGLPAGTQWTFEIGGKMYNSTSSNITIQEPYGNYSYSISSSNTSFVGSPATGYFNLTQYSTLSVTFIEQYNVKFTESGLLSGTMWSVNLSNGTDYTSNTTTLSFSATNGTYNYTLYAPNYAGTSGNFTVNGAPVSQSVAFVHTYQVTYTETGLPSGTMWSVNLSNGTVYTSTTTTLSFSATNGTYNYTLYAANYIGASGNFTVNGAPVSQSVAFVHTYQVTYTETGLPSGTPWYINITGMASSGAITSSTYTVDLVNGTYDYTVSTSDKSYAPSSSSGSFAVNGSAVSQTISFSEVTYKVSFTESGLPAGSTWSVTMNGITNTSSSTMITFMEPNGSYSYTIATTNNAYGASTSSGSVSVNGSAASVSVTFSQLTFTVTFTESGLPSGATWYLNLSDGKSLSSSSTTITVSLVNGTYNYTATSNGYVNKTGSVTLNDSSQSVSIAFTKVPVKSSSNNDLTYIVIGVVVAVVVIGGAIYAITRKK